MPYPRPTGKFIFYYATLQEYSNYAYVHILLESVSATVQALGSARSTARTHTSSNIPTVSTARSTARQEEPEVPQTGRTYLDTARVHTALAALAAEKLALVTKLNFIDSALEAEGKKKQSLTTLSKKFK